MDALSRIQPFATHLLTRADATLAWLGAPADHEVWPLLRDGRLLCADALAAVSAWTPAELRARADLLLRQRQQREAVSEQLSRQSEWDGEAAAAFKSRLAHATAELDAVHRGGDALRACLVELADWLEPARYRLAQRLGQVLSSVEAVALTVGPIPGLTKHRDCAKAAADIGVAVLVEVDRFWAEAGGITRRHLATTDAEGTVRADGGVAAATGTIRVSY